MIYYTPHGKRHHRSTTSDRQPLTNSAPLIVDAFAMTEPVFGVAVHIEVLGVDQIRVSIIDIDGYVRNSVCDVVEPQIERHRNSSWQWPPLHSMCSEVSDVVAKNIIRGMRVVGLTATRMEGTWTGDVIAVARKT